MPGLVPGIHVFGRRHFGAMRSIEPEISRFRVWSFGPSRNDCETMSYFGISPNVLPIGSTA